jgi:L-rhamnose-H+ transport protein
VELNSQVVFAFSLVLIAVAMHGAYGIPLRFMKGWNWENTWAVWTVVSMMLLPLFAAAISVHGLGAAYLQTSLGAFVLMGVFGALWGAGVLMIGISFPLVG